MAWMCCSFLLFWQIKKICILQLLFITAIMSGKYFEIQNSFRILWGKVQLVGQWQIFFPQEVSCNVSLIWWQQTLGVVGQQKQTFPISVAEKGIWKAILLAVHFTGFILAEGRWWCVCCPINCSCQHNMNREYNPNKSWNKMFHGDGERQEQKESVPGWVQ